MPRSITVRVPASSGNLGPGFDTLGLALALHNVVEARIGERASLEFSGSESGPLAQEKAGEDLITRSAREAFEARGFEMPPLALRVECRIPLARGLGSSASAVVAGLMIASRHLDPPLERQELLDLATRIEGHPDNVAAAILGGLTASAVDATGRVHVARLRLPSSIAVLALVPDYQLSTAEARGVLPKQYARADVVHNVSRVALLAALLAQGAAGDLWEALDDRLHQPYRAGLVRGFGELLTKARQLGAIGGFLSGAGPTILVLTRVDDRARIAQKLQAAMDGLALPGRVLPLGVEAAGARYTRASAG